MSQVRLQVRPRRVRSAASCEPPPFRFSAASGGRRSHARPTISGLPLRLVGLLARMGARTVDAAFFLVVITIWCAIHLTVWSFAFQIGPAARCFGLLAACEQLLTGKVVVACAVLAATSLLLGMGMRRLGHRATGAVLLLLVSFDLAALLLMGVHALL